MQPITNTASLSLIVEPEPLNVHSVVDAIRGTQTSLWIEVYEVTSQDVLDALVAVRDRGNIQIQVMIDQRCDHNGLFLAALTALTKVPTSSTFNVQYSQARTGNNQPVTYTHAKFMIIDNRVAYIMTANLTSSAIGSCSRGSYPAYISNNREYVIANYNPQDIATLTAIFHADQNATIPPFTPTNPTRLVVSPFNARSSLYALITSAAPHSVLQIESEELQDPPLDLYGNPEVQSLEQALVDAVQRDVTVQVIIPEIPPPAYASGQFPVGQDANSAGVIFVTNKGVQVYRDPQLYMHAKMIIADNQAFVGSQNLSWTSLNNNREVGMIISDPTLLATLKSTFQQDLAASHQVTQ